MLEDLMENSTSPQRNPLLPLEKLQIDTAE